MANGNTFEQLQVRCRFKVIAIRECSINAKYGEHTRTAIIAIVKGEEAQSVITDMTDENITIFNKYLNDNEEMEERILFNGIINKVELKEEGDYTMLLLEAVSSSWKMDIKKKSRSFQNVTMTYKDVVERIIQDYDADMIWNGVNQTLNYPLIQYKETDYQFLKRILSHVRCGITTGDSTTKICLHVGLKNGVNIGTLQLKQYCYSAIPFQYKEIDKLQIGYKIEDMDFSRVGDVVQIQGRNFYVMESNFIIKQNNKKCNCILFPKQCFEVEKISAETLKSAVLTGKVLKAKQEKVKMHLDIDSEQKTEEAYEFPWKPITGNLLYCMPEIGTSVALYFCDSEEKSASVIYCIRENGEDCEELIDCNYRYFSTDNNKRMYLKPAEMGLLNMLNQNAEIALRDGSGVDVKTCNQLSVLAEGQVELKGKKVTITTPKEATLVKKDIISPTVINMCNAFDAIGKTGNFAASPQNIEKKRKKTVPYGQAIEPYSLDGAVETILSNIPIEEMENPIMEMIAGGMPVISSIGDGVVEKCVEKKGGRKRYE